MRQLVLDVVVSGGTGFPLMETAGVASALAVVAEGGAVYGREGCGKSQFISAMAHKWGVNVGNTDAAAVCVDDLESLEFAEQEKLFHAFNRLQGKRILVASGVPVANLSNLLPDLKSRLLTLPQVELVGPTDDELRALLGHWAEERQLVLPLAVVDYVLVRAARSAKVLADLVRRLDMLSLEQKRAVSVPLARAVLEQDS